MPNSIYNNEGFSHAITKMRERGLNTYEERYQWLQNEFFTMEETPDELRAIFENALPGESITITGEEAERRRQISENARKEYFRLGAERGGIVTPEGTGRELGALYRVGTDPDTLAHNAKLTKAIEDKDFDTIGDMYNEYLQDLPSYDPEMLMSLSPEEAPRVFCALHTLIVAVQEGRACLTAKSDAWVKIRSHLTDSSRQILLKLIDDMDGFSDLKTRCDYILKPHYAYIDTDKILHRQEYSNQLYQNEPAGLSKTCYRFYSMLTGDISTISNSLGYKIGLHLEKMGIDPKQTVLRDANGKTYDLLSSKDDGCMNVLLRGEPLFCTSGDKLKVFALQEGKIMEVQPAAALESRPGKTDAMKKVGALLNGSTADPLWLLTGSSQYRGMKSAYANYKKLVKNDAGSAEINDPKAYDALNKLKDSALEYFKHKKVDLSELPTFKDFCDNRDDYPDFVKMSKRELARMEAAYTMLAYSQETLGSVAMKRELPQMSAYNTLPANGGNLAFNYDERMKKENEEILNSSFLKEPVADENSMDENLRQEIISTLFDEQNGLLNKKFFTKQDRQLIEDALAKAVVLAMIRSDHKIMSDSNMDMETAYRDDPKGMIDFVKNSETFREAMGSRITPNGLRKFFIENRQAAVNKNLTGMFKEKHKEKNLMQKEQLLTKQNTNEMKKEESHSIISG